MVYRVIILKNSLPQKGSLHSVLSPREIVTGKKFRCPKVRIGQYVQGLVGGTNDTETERSINSLCLGRSDNGSGHSMFTLDTKVGVSVNRVVVIPTPASVTTRVNKMGIAEKQSEGIQFSDRDGRVTINDLDLSMNDENESNASNKSFDHNEEYQKEFDNNEKPGNEDLNTD